jgi:predicted pore-forming effector associated with SMODS systems
MDYSGRTHRTVLIALRANMFLSMWIVANLEVPVTGTRQIDQRQNSAESRTLLRAIAVAHGYTQRAQAVSLLTSLIIASLGVVAKVAQPMLQPAAAIIGALWAATYAVLVVPQIGRHLRISATVQEQLDVRLFDLPWNTVLVGDELSEEEVNRLSRRFHGEEAALRDYYLVAAVSAPHDVLFCLEQNLAWGSRVRQRYAAGLLGVTAAWCLTGVVTGVVTESTVGSLISVWFVPSLGLLLSCWDIARAQLLTTRERTRVVSIVRKAMAEPSTRIADARAFTVLARQVQDVLFLARQQQPRTPQWFFRRFHNDDMADFKFKMRALEQQVGGNP